MVEKKSINGTQQSKYTATRLTRQHTELKLKDCVHREKRATRACTERERDSYSNDSHIWWPIGVAEALRQDRQGKHSM
jgi:hypothetical protein